MRLPIIFLSLIFLGAGCFGRGATSADGGVFKTVNSGADWRQAVLVPGAQGVGTLSNTDVIMLTADPQDNRALYIGTRSNGLLFTYDGAYTWQQPLEESLTTGAVSALAVDPTDKCTLYLGRAERLYKSTDCSRSFDSEKYVETRAGVTVSAIAVDWFNPKIVWLGLTNGDLLKSEDSGSTWRISASTAVAVRRILISLADSRQVLVGLDAGGFFRSTDGGGSWASTKEALKSFSGSAKVREARQDASGLVVLAATDYGLLRSSDFGATWESLTLLTAAREVDIYALAFDASNPSSIGYAAGSTFYFSRDGGVTWETHRLPTTRTPTALIMDKENSEVMYLTVAATEEK